MHVEIGIIHVLQRVEIRIEVPDLPDDLLLAERSIFSCPISEASFFSFLLGATHMVISVEGHLGLVGEDFASPREAG